MESLQRRLAGLPATENVKVNREPTNIISAPRGVQWTYPDEISSRFVQRHVALARLQHMRVTMMHVYTLELATTTLARSCVVNASLVPSNTHKLTKCAHTNTQVSAPDYFRAPTRSGALTGPGRPNCLYRTPGPHQPARSKRRSYCRRDAPTARCSSTPCSVRWTHFVVVCTTESMAFCSP